MNDDDLVEWAERILANRVHDQTDPLKVARAVYFSLAKKREMQHKLDQSKARATPADEAPAKPWADELAFFKGSNS